MRIEQHCINGKVEANNSIFAERGRKMIGRALVLHKQWPDEFYEVSEMVPALKKFQWMVDVLRKNHNKVADDLLQVLLQHEPSLTVADAAGTQVLHSPWVGSHRCR